jgi:hypothetical protein
LPTPYPKVEGCNICPDKNCQNRQMDSRGNKGDTQGKPYENSTGDPY